MCTSCNTDVAHYTCNCKAKKNLFQWLKITFEFPYQLTNKNRGVMRSQDILHIIDKSWRSIALTSLFSCRIPYTQARAILNTKAKNTDAYDEVNVSTTVFK